jgi:hypothetical protein
MRLAAVVVVLLAACSHIRPADSIALRGGVILPSSMCARKGDVAASNDAPGNRLLCERQEIVGSHFQRCVCRDENQIVADREATRQAVIDAEIPKCVANGGGSCGM